MKLLIAITVAIIIATYASPVIKAAVDVAPAMVEYNTMLDSAIAQ